MIALAVNEDRSQQIKTTDRDLTIKDPSRLANTYSVTFLPGYRSINNHTTRNHIDPGSDLGAKSFESETTANSNEQVLYTGRPKFPQDRQKRVSDHRSRNFVD